MSCQADERSGEFVVVFERERGPVLRRLQVWEPCSDGSHGTDARDVSLSKGNTFKTCKDFYLIYLV
jgi:hypothetical protein